MSDSRRIIRSIAFVGVGNMGAPMASNLIEAGFELVVFDARRDVAREFADGYGCRAASSLAEAARDADAAITMLPDERAVREVLLGADGLANIIQSGAIAIDMSTSDPHATVLIGEELARKGIAFLDAPVMGGVVFAKDGSLDILVGGDDETATRCIPIFNAVGKSVFRCGALGSGHALKALANYVNAGALMTILEAMTIGRKFGLDTTMMQTALTSMCVGRQHPLEKKIIPHVLSRRFASGMTIGLVAKDLAIARDFARSIEAAAPLLQRACEVWADAATKIGGTADQTEIVKLWEQQSGVTL